MPLRIALATATPHHRCETFVRAHLEGLRDPVLVLTDGSLPAADGEGRPLLSASRAARLAHRVKGLMGPQDHSARLRARIVQLLRERRVEVVLAEYGTTAAELLPCCQAAGVPLVAYFLGFDAYTHDVLRRYGNYRALFGGAARLVAVSRAIREHLIALGAPAEKVVYNSCGADVDRFTPADAGAAPPHFLGVGRFVDKKAPHLLLLAFAEAHRQRPAARLTLVGDGPLWEACHQLVRALGLQQVVDLCGPRTPAEIAGLLHRSRAFVQHSVVTSANDREGTPVAMLEAMACALPVVSTRHGDIAEVVGTERGLLGEERDIGAMAAHLVALIDDPVRAAAMGRAGRAYVMAEHRQQDRIAALQGILQQAAHPVRA